ncbi:hypothetical protein BHM03_00013998 [Ensete ventricosum]|nr:hypothetical protein BHM03_00013998 [Ensete ventricosum]
MHALLDLLFFIAASQPLPSSLTASAPHHYHPRRCPFLASSSAPVAGRRLRLFPATIFLFLLYPTAPSCIFLLNLYRCPAAPASSSAIVVAAPSTACSPYVASPSPALCRRPLLPHQCKEHRLCCNPCCFHPLLLPLLLCWKPSPLPPVASRRCHPLLLPLTTATFSSKPLLPEPSPSSPLHSSSIAVGPLPLKHQQQRRYLAALHLLGAPHDAAASSPAVATLTTTTSSNHAPYRCTSLLPPLPLLAAPCSSPGCRSNRCPSLSLPPLATTAAPTISN